MTLMTKLLMASPIQGSILSRAAFPKRGAVPQQIMVAKAKTKGEIFTESPLFSENEFPPPFPNCMGAGGNLVIPTPLALASLRPMKSKEKSAMKH